MPRDAPRSDELATLADRLAVHSVLATFPSESVDAVLRATGRVEQRQRLLSARTTVYYVLAMGLFPQASYEGVARRLFDALSWPHRPPRATPLPSKAAIYKARMRLGWEPMRALVTEGCAEIRRSASAPVVFGGQRVVAANWDSFALAASEANARAFRDRAADGDPRLGVETLVLAGDGALVAAAISPPARAAATQADALWDSLDRDMLCVATVDEAQLSAWSAAVATGAQLLWHPASPLALRVRRPLSDGSYLAEVTGEVLGMDHDALVRVLDLPAPAPVSSANAPARLVTTLLDCRPAPRTQLERIFQLCAAEPSPLRRLRSVEDRHAVLRSKTPAGATQEAYGQLCLHHVATRLLTARAEAGSSAPRVVSGFPSPKPTVS